LIYDEILLSNHLTKVLGDQAVFTNRSTDFAGQFLKFAKHFKLSFWGTG